MTTPLRVLLPWSKPPLSLNDRDHHHAKGSKVAVALEEARWAIRAQRIPRLIGAEVTLHYRAPDRRRRDADNLAAVLKVAQDALVAEGVLPDDSWVCIPRSGQEIHPPEANQPGALWLTITPLTWPAT